MENIKSFNEMNNNDDDEQCIYILLNPNMKFPYYATRKEDIVDLVKFYVKLKHGTDGTNFVYNDDTNIYVSYNTVDMSYNANIIEMKTLEVGIREKNMEKYKI